MRLGLLNGQTLRKACNSSLMILKHSASPAKREKGNNNILFRIKPKGVRQFREIEIGVAILSPGAQLFFLRNAKQSKFLFQKLVFK
jgi:hypothetical protein